MYNYLCKRDGERKNKYERNRQRIGQVDETRQEK